MQLCDFLAQMEVIAPQALAMDFDNPGLLIGPEKQEIRKVLVALDWSHGHRPKRRWIGVRTCC